MPPLLSSAGAPVADSGQTTSLQLPSGPPRRQPSRISTPGGQHSPDVAADVCGRVGSQLAAQPSAADGRHRRGAANNRGCHRTQKASGE
jgi:hypothetical protein